MMFSWRYDCYKLSGALLYQWFLLGAVAKRHSASYFELCYF
jgi:hypothetical protein